MSGWLGHKADSVSRLEDETSGVQLFSNLFNMIGWLRGKADAASRLKNETSGWLYLFIYDSDSFYLIYLFTIVDAQNTKVRTVFTLKNRKFPYISLN